MRPGMRVLDLAAGAGGKALALAAAMQNQGEIIACDIRGAALAELKKRAARAGVTTNPYTDIERLTAPRKNSRNLSIWSLWMPRAAVRALGGASPN